MPINCTTHGHQRLCHRNRDTCTTHLPVQAIPLRHSYLRHGGQALTYHSSLFALPEIPSYLRPNRQDVMALYHIVEYLKSCDGGHPPHELGALLYHHLAHHRKHRVLLDCSKMRSYQVPKGSRSHQYPADTGLTDTGERDKFLHAMLVSCYHLSAHR